ncbi:MAG TPA: acyltransferase [Ktedonobacteraceae bacterium]|nr:acyltransferase [Ktedonobacteraceae bacterium]
MQLKNMLQSAGRWLGALLEDNKPKNSIAVLDGVRATAIIFVIVYHINRQTGDNLWTQFKYPLLSSISTSGSSGVVLFFVLSGFLLFMPYAKALLFEDNWPSAKVFYLRRVLRIMPGYYLSLFLLILITAPQYLQPGHLHELLLFLTFWMDSSSETFRQLNGPYWTLGIEWWFYMFLPFICLGLYVIARHIPLKKRLPVLLCCLVALMIWGLFLRYWGYYLLKHPGVTLLVPRHILDTVMFFLFGQYGKYLEVFALGMAVSLCYIYSRYAPPQSRFSVQIRKSSYWLWGAGILILVFADMWHFVHDYNYQGWTFFNAIVNHYFFLGDFTSGIGYALCITAVLFGPLPLKIAFTWAPLRWVGLISYGLYIWHLPFIYLLKYELLPHVHITNRFISYSLYWLWLLVIIVPFALLIFVLVEKRWIKLGDRWRAQLEKQRLRLLSEASPT